MKPSNPTMKEKKTEIERFEIQTYYTKDEEGVWLHRKIGDGEWEEIKTPYKELPIKYL